MASGTVTRVVQVPLPFMEVAYLNVDNTNTYTSRKFSTIQAGVVNGNDAGTSGSVGVSFSGTVATINGTALAKSNVTLVLFGK